ncbi:hypothetical protein [Microvirga sp. P5_D2]
MNFAAHEGGDGVPAEPDWASIYSGELDIAAAHEEWGFAIRDMREAQTLTVANGHAIKRLVELKI